MKVAIQGVKASFHDVASRKYFKGEKIETVECDSFPKLFEALASGEADVAIMAIENAIAGSIIPNYSLMEKYRFKIMGEVLLKIEMCLLAHSGVKLEDIKFVRSHPMALLQCREFLMKLKNVSVSEANDTAESAYDIKQQNLREHAAIASRLAGETFGLEVVSEDIASDKSNFTRFLILCREVDYTRSEYANKSSIRFEVEHTPGSLARVLEIFNKHSVNLTKIQSLPVLGKPLQYAFHVDLEWSDFDQYKKALLEIRGPALNLIYFGDYPHGERPAL